MPSIPADIRKEYHQGRLLEADAPATPLPLFAGWLRAAVEAGLREPNAMTLATATPEGKPAARVVLLKDVDDKGFRFFTNYASAKGVEMAANPQVALCFWWGELERQVRVEGRVEKLSPAESDAYFNSRPPGSRLGAWVSAQSQVIANRDLLEERLAALQAEYAGRSPDRPPHWGGYLVVPTVIEFWQGGPNRLHDRLRYTRAGAGWRLERLAP